MLCWSIAQGRRSYGVTRATRQSRKGRAVSDLAKFIKLERRRRRMLIVTAWGVTRARLEAMVLPFRLIAQSLALSDGAEPINGETVSDELEEIRWSTEVLSARLPWCGNCLAQAIAAKRYLNRKRIRSTLFLGVGRGTHQTSNLKAFEAHAWVESAGRVLTGRSDSVYRVIYSQS